MKKFDRIVQTARANPGWTQAQVAAHCATSRDCVKVVLCAARREGLIERRDIDVERSRSRGVLDWLPSERLQEYKKLRRVLGADKARLAIREDMKKQNEVESCS